MTSPSRSVVAVNLFSMLPGVNPADFERFSTEVDRPTCLAHDVVRRFDAYRVNDAPDGAPADILEVMEVTDWAAWEELRDTHPTMKPVTDGFDQLVDPATVRTYFTHLIPGDAR
jgi:REDY-like protein HapK